MKKFTEEKMSEAFRDEDTYLALCARSVPEDFYFHIANLDGFTQIYLVPRDYFEEEGYMWDQSMNLDHLLPSDKFGESMEMVWETEDSAAQTKSWMLSQGFIENSKFTELVIADYN